MPVRVPASRDVPRRQSPGEAPVLESERIDRARLRARHPGADLAAEGRPRCVAGCDVLASTWRCAKEAVRRDWWRGRGFVHAKGRTWMALTEYGVLKGRPIDRRLGAGASPHYQVHLIDAVVDYRIAVNVKSKESPSELRYLIARELRPPPDRRADAASRGLHASGKPARRSGPRLHPRQPLHTQRDGAVAVRRPGARQRSEREARFPPPTSPGRGGRARLRVRAALGSGAERSRPVLRIPAGQRHPRHPHEPGQRRASPSRTTASGRTAVCSSTCRLRAVGRRSSLRFSHSAGTRAIRAGIASATRHCRRRTRALPSSPQRSTRPATIRGWSGCCC